MGLATDMGVACALPPPSFPFLPAADASMAMPLMAKSAARSAAAPAGVAVAEAISRSAKRS